MDSLWSLLDGFWKRPFDPEGDAVNWFLFLGLIAVGFFLWHRIIAKIEERV